MDLSELGWFNLTRLRLSLFFSVKIGLVNVGVIGFLYSKNRGFVFVIIKKKKKKKWGFVFVFFWRFTMLTNKFEIFKKKKKKEKKKEEENYIL